MSKFSIHDPKTRYGEKEALALAMHRYFGVLAPRYLFVDVNINGQSIGIMALEEHFTKEMVESQGRRDGPIVAVDEDWMWRQWDYDMKTINAQKYLSELQGVNNSYFCGSYFGYGFHEDGLNSGIEVSNKL